MEPYIGNGFEWRIIGFPQSGRSAKGQSNDEAERAHGCGAWDARVSHGAIEAVYRSDTSRRSIGRRALATPLSRSGRDWVHVTKSRRSSSIAKAGILGLVQSRSRFPCCMTMRRTSNILCRRIHPSFVMAGDNHARLVMLRDVEKGIGVVLAGKVQTEGEFRKSLWRLRLRRR